MTAAPIESKQNHQGGHHHHHDASTMSDGKIKLSILATTAFVALEIFVGLRSHSLALISDAGHNFTDALALALSWYALWIARKPANPGKTFGYHRVGILAALVNAISLVLIAIFILKEAFTLFLHPQHVDSVPMILVAAGALVMNTVIALGLRGEAAHSVNMRGAFLHMAGDALAAASVVAAGAVIYFTHWWLADPLISALIGLFIIYSSWDMVVETVNILMEGTPRGLDVMKMAVDMQAVSGVQEVHDLHVWSIRDGMNALSCHLRIKEAELAKSGEIVRAVKAMLATQYSVHHSTIETECGGCEDAKLYCVMTPSAGGCDHEH